MSALTDAFERLATGWERHGVGPDVLLPGLSEDEVVSRILTETGLTANAEVVEWFGFANGVRAGVALRDQPCLIPILAFGESLHDALLIWHLSMLGSEELLMEWPGMKDKQFGDERFTDSPDSSFMPVQTGFDRSTMAVRLREGTPGVPVGSAVCVNPMESFVTIKWPSLASVVNEAAWMHLTDRVWRSDGMSPFDSAVENQEPASEQLARPLPEVAEFFGDDPAPEWDAGPVGDF